MKIQKGKMLIEDMNLKELEVFQIGAGTEAFLMVYVGQVKRRGKLYDQIMPYQKAINILKKAR